MTYVHNRTLSKDEKDVINRVEERDGYRILIIL